MGRVPLYFLENAPLEFCEIKGLSIQRQGIPWSLWIK